MSENLYSLVTLDDALRCLREGIGSDAKSISEVMLGLERREGWNSFPDWENHTDEEIYEQFVKSRQPSGRVLIVSDVSYRSGLGAFQVEAARIRSFVSKFRGIFAEYLFNGDLLMIDVASCAIWAFHHEGVYGFFAPSDRTLDGSCGF